jgi:alpha-tubulin suppressor-like RCC1 family protein
VALSKVLYEASHVDGSVPSRYDIDAVRLTNACFLATSLVSACIELGTLRKDGADTADGGGEAGQTAMDEGGAGHGGEMPANNEAGFGGETFPMGGTHPGKGSGGSSPMTFTGGTSSEPSAGGSSGGQGGSSPTAPDGLVRKPIDAGIYHTCLLVDGGSVRCWGNNAYGQIGDGSDVASNRTTPTTVVNLTGAIDVTAGGFHSCALIQDGTVACWGADDYGQRGDGPTSQEPSFVPTRVVGIERAVDVDAGDHFTCALVEDGHIWCWGLDAEGQLGENIHPGETQMAPVEVAGIDNAISITTGGKHACARLSDGRVQCWGYNFWGQLGIGKVDLTRSTPDDVISLDSVRRVEASNHDTCAILTDKSLSCWGFDEWGQLGDGDSTRNENVLVPTPVSALTRDVLDISVGALHVCALLEGDQVFCWGADQFGQVGDAANDDSAVKESPSPVEVDFPVAWLAAGGWHTCAYGTSGEVACWGSNEHGQIGQGTTEPEIVALPTRMK